MGWPQQGKDRVAVQRSGMLEGRMEEPSQFPYKAEAGEGEREKRDSEGVRDSPIQNNPSSYIIPHYS